MAALYDELELDALRRHVYGSHPFAEVDSDEPVALIDDYKRLIAVESAVLNLIDPATGMATHMYRERWFSETDIRSAIVGDPS